jgi:pre-mRNA-processing factor 19
MRPGSSIFSLLNSIQEEWDAILLENFSLKKAIKVQRLEIRNIILENEVGIRILSKTVRERNDFRKAYCSVIENKVNKGSNVAHDTGGRPIVSEKLEISKVSRQQYKGMHRNGTSLRNCITKSSLGLWKLYLNFNVIGGISDCTFCISHLSVREGNMSMLLANGSRILRLDMNNKQTDVIVTSEKGVFLSLTLSYDGNYLITLESSLIAKVWVLSSSFCNEIHKIMRFDKFFHAVAFLPNSYVILCLSRNIRSLPEKLGSLGFISLSLPSELSERAFCKVRVHPDGVVLGFFDHEGSISLKDIRSGLSVSVLHRSCDLRFPSRSKDFKFDSNGYILYELNLNVFKVWDLRRISVSRTCLGVSSTCAISPSFDGAFLLGNVRGIEHYSLKRFNIRDPATNKFSCKLMSYDVTLGYAFLVKEDESVAVYSTN